MNLRLATTGTTSILAIMTLAAASCSFPRPGEPGHFEVTVGVDAEDDSIGDGICRSTLPSGACTLRAAISESNAVEGENTIQLGDRVHTLSLRGSLEIRGQLTIEGSGRLTSSVDGGLRGAIFAIDGANVWMRDFTITNGGETSIGGAIAIRNGGFLTAGNIVVRDSVAYTGAGGIYVQSGSLFMVDSEILDSRATGAFGGGLYVNESGTAILDRTTFSGNTSNRAGAISNFGSLRLTNSTISGNAAASPGPGAGGILNGGVAHLNNVTIYANQAEGTADDATTGGLLAAPAFVSSRTTMSNTIIANNHRRGNPDDCEGSIESYGYNLVQAPDECVLTGIATGNLIDLDPDLLSLSYAGGADTQVHLPRSTSPVVGAGHPQVGAGVDPIGRCEARDQSDRRRQLTGSGERCDIGSIERR